MMLLLNKHSILELLCTVEAIHHKQKSDSSFHSVLSLGENVDNNLEKSKCLALNFSNKMFSYFGSTLISV